MRYIKVLLLVILFFLVMMFFVQNQSAFSQAVALKLDLLFLLRSNPLLCLLHPADHLFRPWRCASSPC